jgi:hypothetical protein
MAYTDGASDDQYYGWTRAGFGDYDNLRQVLKMEQAATAQNKPQYIPIAKFLGHGTFYGLHKHLEIFLIVKHLKVKRVCIPRFMINRRIFI